MSVILPTGFIQSATPRFIDRGGILEAALGGPDQRLDRIGARWGVDFQLVPMKVDDARVWISRLIRGRREKAQIKFPQPGYVAPVVFNQQFGQNQAAGAESITITSPQANWGSKTLQEGVFVKFLKTTGPDDGYIHQVTSDVTFATGVAATVPIQPPLRAAMSTFDSIIWREYDVMITGYVKGDDASWTIDNAKIYGLQFSIEEAK